MHARTDTQLSCCVLPVGREESALQVIFPVHCIRKASYTDAVHVSPCAVRRLAFSGNIIVAVMGVKLD